MKTVKGPLLRKLAINFLFLSLLLCAHSISPLAYWPTPFIVQAEESSSPVPPMVTDAQPPVPWSLVWSKFKQNSKWSLEWFSGSAWLDRKSCLEINRTQPYNNTTKISAILTTVESGSYRLTFAINKKIKHYMNTTEPYQIELAFRDYKVIFDWSDLAAIPNLIIKKGVTDDFFWFRVRKDNIPANRVVVLDPTVVIDQTSSKGVDYPHQLKTFRNPRGLKWNYALIYNQSGSDYKLLMYKSEDGDTWVFGDYIHNFTADDYGSSSLWTQENVSQSCLDIYFVYTELDSGTESLYYRRGTIADASSTITFASEQTIDTGEYRFPTITVAENGYVWITVEKRYGGTETHDLVGFSGDTQEWNVVGASPWIDEANDGDYIWESAKNNEMEYFNFTGGCGGTIVSVDATFYCRQEAGGNDYFEVDIWNGTGWFTSGSVTPTAHATRYFYKSLDVTAELGTDTSVNIARMRLDKQSSGGGDDVFIDQAFLFVDIAETRTVEAWVSTVTYTPTVSDWEENRVVDDAEDGYKLPIVLPLNSVSDTVVLWRVEDIAKSKEYIRARDCNWSGTGSFVNGTEYETVCEVSGGHFVESFFFFRAVVDENNLVHTVAQWYASGPDYYRYYNFTLGSGFGDFQSVTTDLAFSSLSMTIDLSCSPNKLYVMYNKYTSRRWIGYKMDYVDDIDWSDCDYWTEDQDIGVKGLSASYQTGPENVAQMIYIAESMNESIYFEEFRHSYVTYRFWDGGSIDVNGTTRNNGTTLAYKHHLEEFTANVTGIPSYMKLFNSTTYDGTDSTSNPTYITVIEDLSCNTTFKDNYDCNYIGMNTTLAGNPVLFSANWTDLNVTEGLSHFQCLENNSGAWVVGSWSNSWRNTVWADAEYTLNSTAETTVAFRFQANDTDGTLYNSTICFFNTELSGNTSAWTLAALAVGALIVIPSVATIYLITRRK